MALAIRAQFSHMQKRPFAKTVRVVIFGYRNPNSLCTAWYHFCTMCTMCAHFCVTLQFASRGRSKCHFFVLVCCGSSRVSTTMSAQHGQFHQPGLGHGNAGPVTCHGCSGSATGSLRKSHLDRSHISYIRCRYSQICLRSVRPISP